MELQKQPSNSNSPLLQRRNLKKPTTNFETLIHFMKASVGFGIYVMPTGFKSSGWAVGLAGVFFAGGICAHCMIILGTCSHMLSSRLNVPSFDYASLTDNALANGPTPFRRYAKPFRIIVQIFLIMFELGACCGYIVFCSSNLKKFIESFAPSFVFSLHSYMTAFLFLFLVTVYVRDLKNLVPFTSIGNCVNMLALALIFRYLLVDVPPLSQRRAFSSWGELPFFVGIAMLGFEATAVILSLENNMENPEGFTDWNGVLNTGMMLALCLNAACGFYGYLKYGDDVSQSITLNLPQGDLLVQIIQMAVTISVYFTYAIQYYVPFTIMWPYLQSKIKNESRVILYEYIFRTALVIVTYIFAMTIPNIGLINSLNGAISGIMIGVLFPVLIDTVIRWPDELGVGYWRLWKNILMAIFGTLSLIFGTYAAVNNIIDFLEHHHMYEEASN